MPSPAVSLPALPPTFADASPVANAVALRRDALGFFTRLAREAGDFACYELPSGMYYFVNDPALIREVLVTRGDAFVKWSFNDSFPLLFRQGLLGSEQPRHRRMQRIVRPALGRDRLGGYAKTMTDLAASHLDGWQEGEIDLAREFALLTLEIAGQCLFSVSLAGTVADIQAATDRLVRLSERHGVVPEEDAEYDCLVAMLYHAADEILAERRRSGASDDDLFHLLFAAQDADPAGVTDDGIREEMITFLLAGHVTIAATLATAAWLLTRHPDVQAAVQREVADVLAGRPPTPADLPALGWCERVLLETLRLSPPVWSFGRRSLREVEIGGRTLPAGAGAVVCPWVLHRDATRFPDPETFRPARWENGGRDALPTAAFLPFSLGQRACVGERFALLEGPLVLACLAQRWHLAAPSDGTAPVWLPRLILWPRRGVRLRISPLPSS